MHLASNIFPRHSSVRLRAADRTGPRPSVWRPGPGRDDHHGGAPHLAGPGHAGGRGGRQQRHRHQHRGEDSTTNQIKKGSHF